jgi:phosphatidylserine decarboxylase
MPKPLLILEKNHKKVVVSPSYGKIIDITHNNDNYTTIKIILNIWDVHIQYAPMSGILTDLKHNYGTHNLVLENKIHKGKTLNNENLLYTFKSDGPHDISNQDLTIQVRQIAGKFARRCISFIKINDRVEQQIPIGQILFGSQVDLIIPTYMNILCQIDDYLIGGETIIAI